MINGFSRRGLLRLASGLGAASVVGPNAFAQSKPFVIGASLPMSGPFSNYGVIAERSLKAGAARANEAGGILGRQVQVLVRDDAGNPGRALLAVKELVGDQKVDFLYPEQISGLALAVLPFTTEQKVFTITSATAPGIGDAAKFPYSFQYSEVAPKRVPIMAHVLKKLGGTKAGILVSTNPGTTPMGDGLNSDLPTKHGIPVAGYRQFAADAKDFTPLLQQFRDAGADIVAFDSVTQDGVRVIMTGMQNLGWKAKVVSGPTAITGNLSEQIAKEVAGQFYAMTFRVAVRTEGKREPGMEDFIAKLKAFGPIDNIAVSAMNHDVVFLAKWTYETAQKEFGSTSADNLKRTLETVSSRDYPPGYSFFAGKPAYSADDHTMSKADHSKMYGLITVGEPVDGAYKGEPLDITS